MLERQLADVLVQIGLERDVDIDAVASELATLRVPSFVDGESFRNSLLDSIESQLRRQTDEKIRQLRQQLVSVPAAVGAQGRVRMQPDPAAYEPETPRGDSPAPSEEMSNNTVVETENLPEDATMVWKSRDEG